MRSFEGNRVVRHTGSEYPIFQAPIGSMARAQWAGAVSAAGGMGMLETHLIDAAGVKREADLVRQHTNRPFGYHLMPDPLSLMPEHEEGIIAYLEEIRPRFVSMGYGAVSYGVKDKYRFVKRLKDVGSVCYYMVDTLDQALSAEDAGVDGLVVTGAEAGGGRMDNAPHIFTLIQAARKRIDLPLVAAGGIVDGIGMAGAFALGAEGILMGTRFMSAVESPLHPKWKEEVVATKEILYLDVGLNETRMLAARNEFSERIKKGEIVAKPGNPYFGDAKACFYEGRTDLAIVGVGESAILVDAIKTVEQIMTETVSGFWNEIDRLASLGTRKKNGAA